MLPFMLWLTGQQMTDGRVTDDCMVLGDRCGMFSFKYPSPVQVNMNQHQPPAWPPTG